MMQTRKMLDEQQKAIRKPLYKVGNKVKVVNYGHQFWTLNNGDGLKAIDISPELVGKKGIIDSVHITQNIPQYSLSGIEGKHAWYDEEQLKLIKCNILTKILQYCVK